MENSEGKNLGKIFSEVSEISENSEFSTLPIFNGFLENSLEDSQRISPLKLV